MFFTSQPTSKLSKSGLGFLGGGNGPFPPVHFYREFSKNGMAMKIFLEKVINICSSGRKFFGAPTHPSVVFSGRKIAKIGFLAENGNNLASAAAGSVGHH